MQMELLLTRSSLRHVAESKLVITVAAQDIWPQGKTYPIKAVAIISTYSKIPTYQTGILLMPP